ncbi:Mitochondrial import receptor subunit [Venturia nashicola]|uniref:Mitochondrial import receptor subunit n=1 Tax=Venturia nashicola TaxID=86259 RepID=A0A4Z1P3M7_9PEZI|nr:Mitochondrial import receptor subunit [Venturia nashicola]TLD28139.1 Mitochondrial import receptor subunit [Venturia nashicola]
MSTVGSFNSKSPTMKRIMKEASELSQNPSADYAAHPLEHDIFEWHFTLRGPPAPSSFANGLYHGRITLPTTYPLRPPSFRFLTPSGRFEINREICLSISGFHEESWQPAWGIRTALLALRGHMDVESRGQVGGLDADEATRKHLAGMSGAYTCASCGKSNRVIMEEQMQALAEIGDDAKKEEEKVPEELKLAYREDLGKKQESEKQNKDENSQAKSESVPEAKNQMQPPAPAPVPAQPPQRQRQQAEQQAAAALLQLGQTGQLPQQARAGTEDAWLEMMIWAVGAVLAILVARKVLMTFFA